ncbi:TonB-dependent receptor domain-containing protein [Vulcaniibacterium thermophilum]|uniref:TonB-dependent receptor n=1 Tax=Vulcaniibacterium thermophilum TaxID=1169913 RepID=A0A919DA82_9GAMM|nr:TonB-dependent receptor [Vulcaniibacterium thermophilum]GHE31566.1 TonB-dependent receptor [Vulcaniibacterium thermophilum]
MAFKTNPLRDAITYALLVGTFTGTAMAQESATGDQEEAKTLDRIEVTGTRIRQVDVETAQPVTFITRQDIERQGFQSVADILQNISATGTPPITRAQPLSAGEAVGGVYISLRNLGAARTLILLNGRRLGITTSGLADLATIPASAVERIEVLKDGASSIYGSDAIAGVVNVITRTNYEGAQASAYYGQYDEGDGAITRGDFVMGFGGDRGSLTLAAEWTKEDPVFARDRPFSAFPRSDIHPTDQWTAVSQYGGFVTTATAGIPGIPTGSRVMLRPGGNPRNPADYIVQNTNTGSCPSNTPAAPGPGTCIPGSVDGKSNTNEQTDLRNPLESKSLFVDGIFDITDAIRFRTNLMYSNRQASRGIAGYPMQATTPTPSQGGAVVLSGQSYFNPTGADISTWWRRTWEVPRISESDLTTYRFTGVFEGSFDLGERTFDWDVSYLWNQNRLIQETYGNLNIPRLRLAMGPSFLNAQGRVQCGTAANPLSFDACVPFNPFLPAGRAGEGGLTDNAALRNYLFQAEKATGETETTVISANIAGILATLPAGDLGFAFGLENRKEEGGFTPDALAVAGQSTNLASLPTRGSYSVDEAYVEFQIPILADLPFAQELSLNVASRFSDYDTFGETVNNKFALKWKPIDSLMLRATYADGFRAPTIADLYGGGSQTFSFFTDPCDTSFGSSANNPTTRANCTNGVGGNGALGALAATYRQLAQGGANAGAPNSQTPVPFTSGSNPNLQPEISKSQTIGFVWSPDFVEGLGVALDWWKIRIADTIVADSPTQILNDCYVLGVAARCTPNIFTRDPVRGNVNFLQFAGINAGFRKAEGFDFDVTYRLKTERFGDFMIASNSTYTVRDYLVTATAPQRPLSNVGLAGSASTTFRLRSNLNVSWQMGSFGVSWIARYYSGMKESCTYFTPTSAANANLGVQPVTVDHLECDDIGFKPNGALTGTTSQLTRRRSVGSNTFNDVQFRWEAPWNATIAVGANNVFEKIGPVMYTQPSANVSYYGGFDIGRFWYLKYTQRF